MMANVSYFIGSLRKQDDFVSSPEHDNYSDESIDDT